MGICGNVGSKISFPGSSVVVSGVPVVDDSSKLIIQKTLCSSVFVAETAQYFPGYEGPLVLSVTLGLPVLLVSSLAMKVLGSRGTTGRISS